MNDDTVAAANASDSPEIEESPTKKELSLLLLEVESKRQHAYVILKNVMTKLHVDSLIYPDLERIANLLK